MLGIKTWILIVFFSGQGGVGMFHVPGFVKQEECHAAAQKILQGPSGWATCIEQTV